MSHSPRGFDFADDFLDFSVDKPPVKPLSPYRPPDVQDFSDINSVFGHSLDMPAFPRDDKDKPSSLSPGLAASPVAPHSPRFGADFGLPRDTIGSLSPPPYPFGESAESYDFSGFKPFPFLELDTGLVDSAPENPDPLRFESFMEDRLKVLDTKGENPAFPFLNLSDLGEYGELHGELDATPSHPYTDLETPDSLLARHRFSFNGYSNSRATTAPNSHAGSISINPNDVNHIAVAFGRGSISVNMNMNMRRSKAPESSPPTETEHDADRESPSENQSSSHSPSASDSPNSPVDPAFTAPLPQSLPKVTELPPNIVLVRRPVNPQLLKQGPRGSMPALPSSVRPSRPSVIAQSSKPAAGPVPVVQGPAAARAVRTHSVSAAMTPSPRSVPVAFPLKKSPSQSTSTSTSSSVSAASPASQPRSQFVTPPPSTSPTPSLPAAISPNQHSQLVHQRRRSFTVPQVNMQYSTPSTPVSSIASIESPTHAFGHLTLDSPSHSAIHSSSVVSPLPINSGSSVSSGSQPNPNHSARQAALIRKVRTEAAAGHTQYLPSSPRSGSNSAGLSSPKSESSSSLQPAPQPADYAAVPAARKNSLSGTTKFMDTLAENEEIEHIDPKRQKRHQTAPASFMAAAREAANAVAREREAQQMHAHEAQHFQANPAMGPPSPRSMEPNPHYASVQRRNSMDSRPLPPDYHSGPPPHYQPHPAQEPRPVRSQNYMVERDPRPPPQHIYHHRTSSQQYPPQYPSPSSDHYHRSHPPPHSSQFVPPSASPAPSPSAHGFPVRSHGPSSRVHHQHFKTMPTSMSYPSHWNQHSNSWIGAHPAASAPRPSGPAQAACPMPNCHAVFPSMDDLNNHMRVSHTLK